MSLSFSLSATDALQWLRGLRPFNLTEMSSSTERKLLYPVPRREAVDSVNDCKSSLIGVIESQIIPRILCLQRIRNQACAYCARPAHWN